VSAEHGKMAVGQAEYIHNVFRFGELKVSDVTVHRTEMVTVNADDPAEEIVDDILASPSYRVPVWEGEQESSAWSIPRT
jgi:Mg2+/Co2+ transporter CorB